MARSTVSKGLIGRAALVPGEGGAVHSTSGVPLFWSVLVYRVGALHGVIPSTWEQQKTDTHQHSERIKSAGIQEG